MKKQLGTTFALLCGLAMSLTAQEKWSLEAPASVKWSRVILGGTYLFSTEKGLHAIDTESGKLLWTRTDLGKLLEFNIEEVPGIPLLFIAENSRRFSNNSSLVAISLETGEDVWKTEKMKGVLIDLVGNRAEGMVVALSCEFAGNKVPVRYIGFDIATGQVKFEGGIKDKADLYINEKSGKFMPRLDLDGHAQPTFEEGAMYLAYAGLHKIDTKTGAVLWGAPFDVTEGHYKRTNSSPIVDGGLVYSSAKGIVRAFDKTSGTLKWTSSDFGAAIPEILVRNNLVIARMGGTYFDSSKREFELKKPLGIVALDSGSGQLKWHYDGAKESTTNMVYDAPSNTVMIADARSLVGLKADAAGGAKEAFRVPLEFKAKSSGGKKAAKMAGKFALGGVRAMARKDNSDEDFPLALVPRQNGTVVVRAKQHLLSFKPATHEIAWGVEYKAPDLPGWQKLATTAAFAMAYYMNTGTALNTQLGTSTNTQANNMRQDNISGMFGAWSKRFSAANATFNYAYMLTDVEMDNKGAPGIVGVNLDSGETEQEVVFNDREPDYVVDELHGIVVRTHKSGKQIVASSLR
ncbi:outer membrane protein assembly factor BamB family protein [Paludibaculum fermentans]|uniref:PQQ-binding-like beta-propeller repeat protein n=1 Tax=Paludibaculum fermentans TaxID=1473598 RepID=A0A7S7NL60_PALFE|nr:PQQ-binding-like beta-propeller repeat protein [Paludibaculum fermentans]QOY85661.1 PQQ-binding-like beta-propeller repeat protein [Paludibaculum fermentans]